MTADTPRAAAPEPAVPGPADAAAEALRDEARRLDAADPLARHLSAFAEAPGVEAYLDGNSLGRPLAAMPAP